MAAMTAVDTIFSHGSKNDLLLIVQSGMGLMQSLHHYAIGSIANKIIPLSNCINSLTIRVCINATPETHCPTFFSAATFAHTSIYGTQQ